MKNLPKCLKTAVMTYVSFLAKEDMEIIGHYYNKEPTLSKYSEN